MTAVTLVCLANSRRSRGRCVAGITIPDHRWIRPVNPGGAALFPRDTICQDGSVPQVLDVISMSLTRPEPLYYQPENWIITPGHQWRKVGRYPVAKLDEFCTGDSSIFHGGGDRLSEEECKSLGLTRSLLLIKPRELRFCKTVNPKGNDQIRAHFSYGRYNYDLVVTDSVWESKYSGLSYETHEPDDDVHFLLISLGENFHGYHYKLVAAVIS